jgi:hypothetical protein
VENSSAVNGAIREFLDATSRSNAKRGVVAGLI